MAVGKTGKKWAPGTEVGQKAVLGVWGREVEREKLERFNFLCKRLGKYFVFAFWVFFCVLNYLKFYN